MVHRSPFPPLEAKFDKFLFASIGTDGGGLQTTVISMFGRMDLDPWQAAADFAGRPVKAAEQKLAAMILALGGEALEPAEADATAVRLVALLPQGTVSPVRWDAVLPARSSLGDLRIGRWRIGRWTVLMAAVVVLVVFLVASG